MAFEEGKETGLVVIGGNPIDNPDETLTVSLVFKEGVGYNPTPMIEDVEGQVGVR